MDQPGIRWGAAVIGAIVAEVAQVAAAFGWVAIYSYLINPGQSMAVYHAHAISSGPWVSIIAGFPIFYAASRWIAQGVSTALALWAIFLAVDIALFVASVMQGQSVPLLLAGASYLSKLLACYLGGRQGAMTRATPQA